MARSSPPCWLWPDAGLRTLRVVGPDRLSWLHGVLTCDVKGLRPGQGRFGLLLTKQGKIQSEVLLLATDEATYLGYSASEDLAVPLDRMLVMEDAEIESPQADSAWLRLYGAKAVKLTKQLSGVVACGGLDWRGHASAFALVEAAGLQESLVQLGRSHPELPIASSSDRESLRLAWQLPRHGVDYGDQENPHEASLERLAIDWTKGCYLGQEVVCMQDMRGKVKRRLVVLETEERVELSAGEPVSLGQDPIGEVTSAAPHPQADKTLLFARLGRPHFEAPGPFQIAGVAARVLGAGDG